MLDVTTVREIKYDGGQTIIVYRDHDEQNIWYMVPVPTLRRVGSAPAFALTKYVKNGGGIAGLCAFEMELIQPPEARAAAEKALGGNVIWGGFTWVGGTAFFHFEIDGESQVLAVEPTLYGTNVAAFQVELATDAAVNSFINAFSGGEGASTFSVEYDMQVLTKLLGAKATVKYKAEAAIEYERKYRTERDTWGNQRTILQEVKQVLKQSGAGDVMVEIGAGGTPELEQRVRDWAWTTLEQQVAATVNAAAILATGPNPVSATTSFEKSYREDTVIDWSTPVSRMMEKFTQEEWAKLYSTVDNRKLAITFNLIGQLTRSDNNLPIARQVSITVDYPTRKTDNTFTLIVTDGAKSAKLYEAPGDFATGPYNPTYRYKYVIQFNEGLDYTSDWIQTQETLVNITPSNFGTRQVTFIGQSVPFVGNKPSGNVQQVEIDFFFTPPAGNPAIVQTKRMTANDETNAVLFDSHYNLPIGPEYNFKLRYLMSDNSVITSGEPFSFSDAPNNTNSGNANIVYVLDPKDLYTQFNLRTFTIAGSSPIAMVDLTAQYFDTQNSGDGALFQNTWNAWQPTGKPAIETALPPWNFQAVDNTNTAYFNMQGLIYYPDGSTVTLSNYKQPSGLKVFMIWSDSENYSIEVFTQAIDWKEVANVNLTLFRLSPGAQAEFGETLPDFLLKPRWQMNSAERLIADRSQLDVYGFSLMDAPNGQPIDSFTRHYSLRRPASQPNIEFYYTAQYILKADGETRTVSRREVVDELFINLPPVPQKGGQPGLVHHVISPVKLKAYQTGKKGVLAAQQTAAN
jgi:hypothetical protein